MKKEKVRINLDVTKEISDKLKIEADKKSLAVNALIRLILLEHLNKKVD